MPFARVDWASAKAEGSGCHHVKELLTVKACGRPPRTIYDNACDDLSPRVAFGGLAMVP
jgi:hypothetical protein